MKHIMILFCICLWISPARPQNPLSAEMDSLILRGIDHTFCCQFDSARNAYQQIIDRYPGHPAGYFYQAANLQSEMMDYETDLWEIPFYEYIEEVIRLTSLNIDRGDENPWTYFYLGCAYSYKGLFQAKTGNLLSGFISASKGIGHLKKVVDTDSTLYDAYLGLGNYKYWAGKFYKFLRWLPWIRDERTEGIQMIQSAVERGTFSYWVGMNSLGWIEFDRKNYRDALAIFRKGMEKYPGSRFFLWGLADSYFAMHDYSSALVYYQQLLASLRNVKMNNGYNEIQCSVRCAIAFYALKQYETALHLCITILDRKVDTQTARRLKKQYAIAEEYKKLSAEALGRIKIIRE
jgi:tetratricopeptide (TPR) repeat protein